MKSLMTLLFFSVNAMAAVTTAAPGAKNVMTFDQKEGELKFHTTTHPGSINIDGTGPMPIGALTLNNGKLTGELKVDLTKLDAGMSMRTTHMKEKALEVDKFPEAKLVITDLKLISGADTVPFTGDLTLHGVTKTIEGKAKVDRKEEALNVHADFDLKWSDYGIVVKPFAGVSVDEKVSVAVDSKANLSPPVASAAPAAATVKQ
jgi:polyisoprenoid-binding protein YceI